MIDGEVNLRNCTEAFLRCDDVQALLAKTTHLENTTGSARIVRVKTTSGQVYEHPLLRPKDMTDPGEIRRKYADCAVAVTGEAQARRIEATVFDLDKVQDVEEFAALLRL